MKRRRPEESTVIGIAAHYPMKCHEIRRRNIRGFEREEGLQEPHAVGVSDAAGLILRLGQIGF